jgi:hypothetical protein
MRLMSVIAFFASIGFGAITILNRSEGRNENGLFITFAFLLGTFTSKALQKFAEAKFPVTEKPVEYAYPSNVGHVLFT